MARPTKLTPQTTEKLVQAIRLGATYEHACNYAGIHYDTFNRWMKKGAVAKSGMFYEFYESIKSADGQAVVGWLAKIEKAANDGSWQAAAWKLERRHPSDYGRQRIEVEHAQAPQGQTLDEWKKQAQQRIDEAQQTLEEFDDA